MISHADTLAADQRGNVSTLITANNLFGAVIAPIPAEDRSGLARGGGAVADTNELTPELAIGIPGANALVLVSVHETSDGIMHAGSTVRLSSATESGLSTRTRTGDEFGASAAALHDHSRLTGLPVMTGAPRQAFSESTAEQMVLAVGAPGAAPRLPLDDGGAAGCSSHCGELWILRLQRSDAGHAQPGLQPAGSPWRWEVTSESRIAPSMAGAPAALSALAASAGSQPRFGATVASLGDVDSSGTMELAVGAPGADGGDGAVLVLSLSSNG